MSHTARSQGRIVKANPELYEMLRQQSESSVASARRLHMDSPGGEYQDDVDKYKYVSPNVEDFDADQDHALSTSNSVQFAGSQNDLRPNGSQQRFNSQKSPSGSNSQSKHKERNSGGGYRQKSRHNEHNSAGGYSRQSKHDNRNSASGYSQQSKHDDRNSMGGYSRQSKREDGQSRDGYSRQSKQASARSMASHQSPGRQTTSELRAIQPLQQGLTAEEERELEELRQEEQYQAELRKKLNDDEEAANIVIPRLQLSDSDDEEKRINLLYKDSLDINLRDSMDDLSNRRPSNVEIQPIPLKLQDSMESQNAALEPQDSLEMAAQSGAGAQPSQMQYHEQTGPQSYNQQPYAQPLLPHNPTDEERLRALVGEEQPPLAMGYDQDPRLMQMFQPAPQNDEWSNHQGYVMGQGSPGRYAAPPAQGFNQPVSGRYYPDHMIGGPFLVHPEYKVIQEYTYPNTHHAPQHSEPEVNLYTETAQRVQQGLPVEHRKIQSVTHHPAPPDKDHIQKNKERINKPPSGKKYRAIHAQKKEDKENTALMARSRKSLPNSVVTGKDLSSGSADPETIWQRRATSLAEHKEGRLSGGKKKMKVAKKPPGGHEPEANRYGRPKPQQAFMEPAHAGGSGQLNDAPVSHTLVTENGQRISVDINLKMLSPGSDNAMQPLQQNMYSLASPTQQYSPPHAFGPRPYMQHQPADMHMSPHMSPHYNSDTFRPAPQQVAHQQMVAQQQMLAQEQMLMLQQQQQMMAGSEQMMGHQMSHHMSNMTPYMGFPQQSSHYQMAPQDYQLQDEGYGSYGHGGGPAHAPDEQPATPGSPYKVLPPINSADSNKGRDPKSPSGPQGTRSPRRDEGGSYMNTFKKGRSKHVEYKAYTLKDYRSMNKEVKLAGLGPDLDSDSLRERRERAIRQQDYARQIQERNRTTVKTQKVKKEPEEDDITHRRRVAIEYAKSVPKPKVKPRSDSTASQPQMAPQSSHSLAPSAAASGRGTATLSRATVSPGRKPSTETIDLEELQRRHQREKQQADLIRQNIQGVS